MKYYLFLIASLLVSNNLFAADALTGTVEKQPLNTTAITMFLVFVITTLLITVWAAIRSKTTSALYTGGGGISYWQNGLAIAGDFISAASFLGITSALFFIGLDGSLLIIGVMGSWPVILFLIAERLRNLGRYTRVDVVSFRLKQRPVKLVIATASLAVLTFYLIGQLVGAGKLIQLLFGLDYIYALIIVSTLMIIYVSLGGMLATTWVQFIKAILLVLGGGITSFLVLKYFNFEFGTIFNSAVESHPKGLASLQPGLGFKNPFGVISLGLTMLLGFIGLPHVLMRMFTVKDAAAARKSSFVAISIMSLFYLMVVIIGFGAIAILNDNPDTYYDAAGNLKGGGNMVAVHIAHFVGGDFLLGFMAAVTFATILAVVAGLTLSASATIAHDLYRTFSGEKHSERTEMIIMRSSVVGVGIIGILLGVIFENQNVAFVTTFALAVSASVNAPILIASMYWKNLTTRGVVWSGIIGLVSSIILIVLGPLVWVNVLGNESPVFPFGYPTIATLPITLICLYAISKFDNSDRAKQDRAGFEEQYIRSELGVGAADASNH